MFVSSFLVEARQCRNSVSSVHFTALVIAVGLPHRPAGASVHALPRRVLHRRDGVRSVIAACRRAGTLQMLQAFQQK